MREFRNFAFLLGIVLTIFSCQTDSFEEVFIQTDENISVNNSVSSRAVTDCGFIPELCTRPYIPVAQHEPAILTPCCDSIVGESEPVQSLVFKNGNDLYRVYTLDLFDNSIDYVVVDQNKEIFFLLKTEDPYLKRHSKEIALPNGLNLVANLNHSKLEARNLSFSEVNNSIGQKANVTNSNGELLIDITNTNDDDVQALVRYDWCKYVIPSTIRKYKNELMSSYEIINPDYLLDIAIEESVLECTPDLCLDCADPKCVIDKMINHPQISGASLVVRDIKINYLRLLLDLTEEHIEWLENNPSILDDLFDTYDLNFRGTGQVESRSIGCDMNICGAEGAAQAHINLLMSGVTLSLEESSNLCDFYTNLYNTDKARYRCFVETNNFAFQYAIATINTQSVEVQTILNDPSYLCDAPLVIETIIDNNDWPNPIIWEILWNYIEHKWNKRNSPYNQANDCEKELMKDHPLCASQLGFNWVSVNLLTKYNIGNNSQNDCSDAFRHTFFNSLNAALCGSIELAREFGEAHECETSSQKAKTMDLHNNEVGYSIIENNQSILDLLQTGEYHFQQQGMQALIEEICNTLANGEMLIFTDPDGIDPDNDPTNLLISSESCECIN